MNILLIGSGGREHAIALKLKESPSLGKLFIAPGNGGTALLGENVPIKAENIEGLADFTLCSSIDLVIVGPEVPLCLGLEDLIKTRAKEQNKKIAFFGPSKACARLEASKDFSKEMMSLLSIPTARYSSFTDFQKAKEYIEGLNYPFVIKADGLAAGKGVILPSSKEEGITELKNIMVKKQFGSSGDKVVIEERLEGEEVSILAFSDGEKIAVMPPSQDHKRLKDNDEGPNTGGMGAYAPAPICSYETAQKYAELTILPIIKEMKKRGTPYIGVLYAGLMLTKEGNGFAPKVLEYNCRFGDPETQSLMQLFDGDLALTMKSCAEGRLETAMPKWKEGYAATVVLASEGYPLFSSKPVELSSTELQSNADVSVIHAGTALKDGKIFTAGGRVLCISSNDNSLQRAMDKIYAKIKTINFPGVQYRKDIAKRGLEHLK
ncbi:phosphoribosylamine--glycine ligase [Treponema sp. OMZ 799]|uniref:phosphoribosylamine--glycine ligase n=1 Tax=Treponema sp. OMZ 799 TaxID=2563668 RepID=UPI0020A54AD6|nr:phosphoribosylamine--glycine ligase [Treponema sp. OMZ 799]UTC77666.1 phosphoribosylamine--glycine ligase [Treponema sp. OMZ 799]